MRRSPLLGFARVTRAAIAVVLLLMPVPASAQDVTEPALKAAFIYNFALFTEWPAGVVAVAEPFVMCVLGDAAVAESLERSVKGRVLAGHSIIVSQVSPAVPQRMCHVVYVSGVAPTQAAQIIAGFIDVPVLTISDLEGFTALGGIAEFFFDHGQLRFNVRVESARRARLQINSRLLALSKRK